LNRLGFDSYTLILAEARLFNFDATKLKLFKYLGAGRLRCIGSWLLIILGTIFIICDSFRSLVDVALPLSCGAYSTTCPTPIFITLVTTMRYTYRPVLYFVPDRFLLIYTILYIALSSTVA